MRNKFKAEDFTDAIQSIGALGSFPENISDFLIRNSDEYKEACVHLHKDMLEQTCIVADMDSFKTGQEVVAFKFPEESLLIGLEADIPDMKRMLSITQYEPDDGGPTEMIVVPILRSRERKHWQPAGLVIFLREIFTVDEMMVRAQVYPGCTVPQYKLDGLTTIIMDAMNTICAAFATDKVSVKLKEPSKLKQDRATQAVITYSRWSGDK